MQISKVVKKFLVADLIIGLSITLAAWTSVGTEGMAAKFCELTDADRCDEIEWSEEYNRSTRSDSVRENEEGGDGDEYEKSKSNDYLRWGF